MKNLTGHSIPMLSYVDPFVAIFISAIVLQEQMTVIRLLAGALLISSTLMSEAELFKMRIN